MAVMHRGRNREAYSSDARYDGYSSDARRFDEHSNARPSIEGEDTPQRYESHQEAAPAHIFVIVKMVTSCHDLYQLLIELGITFNTKKRISHPKKLTD